jgi:uncharacterized damage-inducible protein DinB
LSKFVTPLERIHPPPVASEREALGAWLDWHRATLLRKLDGLDDEQMRRPMVPTGLCLLGLVKHLTAVEFGWFDSVFLQSGELHPFEREDDPEAEFRIGPEDTTELVVGSYLKACERSREIVAGAASLDETVPHPRGTGEMDLRRILIHMVEETARHNGHADIIRELIDGATGY